MKLTKRVLPDNDLRDQIDYNFKIIAGNIQNDKYKITEDIIFSDQLILESINKYLYHWTKKYFDFCIENDEFNHNHILNGVIDNNDISRYIVKRCDMSKHIENYGDPVKHIYPIPRSKLEEIYDSMYNNDLTSFNWDILSCFIGSLIDIICSELIKIYSDDSNNRILNDKLLMKAIRNIDSELTSN